MNGNKPAWVIDAQDLFNNIERVMNGESKQ